MNIGLAIRIDWPHNKFAIGWEVYHPDSIDSYYTLAISLTFITILIDYD